MTDLRAALRRVPPGVWLAAIVVLSALLRIALGRRQPAPWIMVDELIYSELAKSFAATGHLLVRDVAVGAYPPLYPLLISPAYRLFESIPDAYAAAKAINAVVMSLAAVPAYGIARRVLRPGPSLAAAALAVAVPSMVYTGSLMTESLFYPVFLAAALALVRCLEQPTVRRQLILLVAIAAAVLTRTQAVALLPAALTAPLLLGLFDGRRLRALIPYRVFGGILAGGGALVAVAQLARGHSLLDLLGAYRSTGEEHYDAGEVLTWLLRHVAELDLYLAVVPFASFLVLLVLARRLDPPLQALVAATSAISLWLLLLVSMFASLPSVLRIEERYTFYVAPLYLVALLAWIDRGLPRPRPLALAAALAAAALPLAIPYRELIGITALSDTLELIPLWRLHDPGMPLTLSQVPLFVAVCSTLAAALWLGVPRRYAAALPALVAAAFLGVSVTVNDDVHGFRHASLGSLFVGIGNPQRDWIDRAVGPDADVTAVWTGSSDRYTIWLNEFFSRSVGRVLYTGDPLPGPLAQSPVKVDPKSGVAHDDVGRPVRVDYVLVDGSFVPQGEPIAADERWGMTLYRVNGELVSTTDVVGLYPNDTWSGRDVTYTRRHCPGGTLTASVSGDPGLFATPTTQHVSVLVGGEERLRVAVVPGVPRDVVVPLEPRSGRCVVTFRVSPTAVPATETNGENPDPRMLGLHFTAFRLSP